jgi:hypothetical protein
LSNGLHQDVNSLGIVSRAGFLLHLLQSVHGRRLFVRVADSYRE